MSEVIYSLCALTALLSAALLLRSFLLSGYRLLLWSGLCFVGLTITNVLLVMEKVVLRTPDLSTWRSGTALLALSLLLFGLIYEEE